MQIWQLPNIWQARGLKSFSKCISKGGPLTLLEWGVSTMDKHLMFKLLCKSDSHILLIFALVAWLVDLVLYSLAGNHKLHHHVSAVYLGGFHSVLQKLNVALWNPMVRKYLYIIKSSTMVSYDRKKSLWIAHIDNTFNYLFGDILLKPL